MEDSLLFEMIRPKYVNAVKDKIEKEDPYGYSVKLKELQEQIANKLDEEGKTLFEHYSLMKDDWKDDLYDFVGISVLNAGVKIGMQLQDAFLVDELKLF